MWRSISIWILFVASIDLKGQLDFQSFTIEHGLSQNSVYSISQTKEGLLWLGTNDGLNSFDGKYFKVYRPKSIGNEQRSSIIKCIIPYNEHVLLIGTENEFLVFNLHTLRFHLAEELFQNIKLPQKISPINFIVNPDGSIYIATLAHGLFYYNAMTRYTTQYFEHEKESQFVNISKSNNNIYALTYKNIYLISNDTLRLLKFPSSYLKSNPLLKCMAIKNDTLIISGSTYGLQFLKIDFKNDSLSYLPMHVGDYTHKDCNIILPSNDNKIWLGSRSKGISVMDLKTNKIEAAQADQSKKRLNKNFILSLFEDQNNNIWIGQSGGGLSKQVKTFTFFESISPMVTNIKNDAMIFDVFPYKDSKLYMGTLTGGLLEYDIKQKSIHYHFNQKLEIEARNIYDIKDMGEYLWLATWAGLCSFHKKTKEIKLYRNPEPNISEHLYALLILDAQQVIMTSGEYGTSFFDLLSKKWKPKHLYPNQITKITARYLQRINGDNIGMATSTKNFIIYDLKNKSIIEFDALKNISPSSRHFYIDKTDTYIATDRGLIQFDMKSKAIIKLWDTSSGIADNFIYGVLKDRLNNVWMSHNRGLSQINMAQSRVVNFSKVDGLQDLEFNTASCGISEEGRLYFGGINGVNKINDLKYPEFNCTKKPIITLIKVMNQEASLDTSPHLISKLILPHNKNFISFDFIAPNANNIDELNYQFKLDGLDEGWVDAGRRSYANFTHLPPGKYTFNVKSYDNYGNISIGSSPLYIEILKPFYAKTWVLFTTSLLIIFIGSGSIWYRIKSLKRKYENQLQMANLEMNALHTQINAHFIFNSLNNIMQMIMYNENASAAKYLNRFSGVLRSRIENAKQNFISLSDEIDNINKYLEIEKLRISELQLIYEISHTVDLKLYQMPPFILQPIIEDLIWLHVLETKGGNTITIKIYSEFQYLNIDILSNDVDLFTSSSSGKLHKNNLQTIINRIVIYNKIYHTNYKLEVIKTDNDHKKENIIRFTMINK